MKTKQWAAALAVVAALSTAFAACDNKSERREAGDAVEGARKELEEVGANPNANSGEKRAARAEYDSAKADYERMNNPAKRDSTDEE